MKKLLAENPKGVIVIVHGAFEHSGRYDWLTKKWHSEGYHVIYGDLPAHGETEGTRGHIESFNEYIESIESWVKEGKKLHEKVIILGHSMGGLAVIRTLQDKELDVSGVILSSPAIDILAKPTKPIEYISKAIERIKPSLRFPTNMNPNHVTRCEEMLQRDKNDPLILKKVSARWYQEFQRAIDQADFKKDTYPNVPTLVLQAGNDKLVNAVEVYRWFEEVEIDEKDFKEWDNLYHEVFNEPEKDEVFSYTLDYVERRMIVD